MCRYSHFFWYRPYSITLHYSTQQKLEYDTQLLSSSSQCCLNYLRLVTSILSLSVKVLCELVSQKFEYDKWILKYSILMLNPYLNVINQYVNPQILYINVDNMQLPMNLWKTKSITNSICLHNILLKSNILYYYTNLT